MDTKASYFEQLSVLWNVVSSTSDRSVVPNKIVEILEDPDVRNEFYLKLNDHSWINPLSEQGYFKLVESDGVNYSEWAESKYLARMAKLAPEEVARIFCRIETDNYSVIQDLLRAALNMPAEIATSLVPKVCTAYKSGALRSGFNDAAELCVRLANDEEADAAMTLAECLFAILDQRDVDRSKNRDDYWYFKGLQKVVPALVSIRTEKFLKLLLGGLDVIAKSKSHKESDPENDGSPWWRPAIEEHEQNSSHEFGSKYVGCIREALEIAIRDERIEIGSALGLLDKYPLLIFKRLRLHLINTFAARVPALATMVMMDRTLFKNYLYKHEYAMLCGQCFQFLNSEKQDEWLGWIDTGPDMSDFDDSVRNGLGRETTEKDRRDRIEYWQLGKLHWIRDHLEGDRLEFYQRMVTEQGEPPLADLNVRHGAGHWGHESPFTVDEFERMDFFEVLDLLTAWRPDKPRTTGPSVEGAASTFKQYLTKEPSNFFEQAELLKNRPAIYVRTYLEVMKETLAQSPSVDLSAIVRLCNWVIGQPMHEDVSISQQPDLLEDKDWEWTRNSISEFVNKACKLEVSLDYRQDFWDLIVPLTSDSAESYTNDSLEEDPSIKDFATLSLNSACGTAMNAVFDYARWVANTAAEDIDGKKVLKGGFDHMPEVRELLEDRLSPDDPGGFMLRATYGWYWSLIHWIDKEWLARNAARICDLETIEKQPEKAFGWAAWNTFLMATPPHIDYYRTLQDQFSYAVDQAAHISADKRGLERPIDNLGEHLMVLYGRGQLSLDDDDRIIQRLLRDAAPFVRIHAIEFVGRRLWEQEAKDISDAVEDRFMKLWDWYWPAIG